MADTKSAAEIEDILSSIRRLVSTDRKPAPGPRPQILSRLVVEDEPEAAGPAPLLLTPALRVAAKVTPITREAARTWPEEGSAPAAAPSEALPRLHLQPAPKPADSLAWEAEMGDPAPDLASLDWSSFTFARRPMAETYAARSRAVERLVTERLVAERPVAAPAPVAEAPEVRSEAPVETRVDLAAESVEAEPVQQEEDSIFSEDVLRELVRDLIREQLQGELGERITRNIRKLIKAEIARTVSVKALE